MTLVDTGAGVTLADERKLKGYVNPVEVIKRLGVDASNVTKVVISHMHWDHVGGMEMFPQAFPKATFYGSSGFRVGDRVSGLCSALPRGGAERCATRSCTERSWG